MPCRYRLLLAAILLLPVAAVRAEIAATDAPTTRLFDVLEYVVEGNSVLPQTDVERAVYPFLGPERGIPAVEKAREALEKAYHDAGFLTVLVDIPEQRVTEGVVQLRVTEGRVERLKVSGNRYYSRGEIRAGAPSLAAGEVPNFNEAQKDLAALSRTPDRRVMPLLRPGRAPGTVEIELKVDDDLPLHGNLELNNKQSPDTTDRRLEASVRYDNLWQKRHSVGASFQNSPLNTDQVEVFTGTYSAPLGAGILAAYAVRSNSNLATAGGTSVLGKGTTLGLRFIRPLPARDSYFHSLSAGFDAKNFDETTNLIGADTAKKPIRYVPFGVQYTGGLLDEKGQWQFNLGATWSVRGFSDRTVICDDGLPHDQFECKRHGAKSNFAVVRGDLQRNQTLVGGWDMTARFDFQAASQPLISNEQFAAGGVDSVRGYYDAERTGDDAVRARLEVRAPGLWPESGVETRLLGFFDWASLRIQQPDPGQEGRYAIGSWGIGLRLRDSSGLRLALDWAQALRAGANDAAGAPRTKKNDARVHVRIGYEF
jgi:hemolysin activation/secretion protein